jgi:hypothetical protein
VRMLSRVKELDSFFVQTPYPGGQVGTDVTSADRVQVPTPGRQVHVVTPAEFGALSRPQHV